MKILTLLILACLTSTPVVAASLVRIKALFIEAGPSTVITKAECAAGTVRNRKGVKVLAAPNALVRSGTYTNFSIDEIEPVPASGGTTNGVLLIVSPRIEGDVIKFSATATVRRNEREETTAESQAREFANHGFSFSGALKNGESTLLRAKNLHDGRRLSLYLSLTKESDGGLAQAALKPLPAVTEGVYYFNNMYSTTILELKEGQFRYWFSSDLRSLREPTYPLSGRYAASGGVVTLPHREIYQTNWTFMNYEGKTTLWRPSALEFWEATMEVDPYGVLYPTTEKPEEIWERKGFRKKSPLPPPGRNKGE